MNITVNLRLLCVLRADHYKANSSLLCCSDISLSKVKTRPSLLICVGCLSAELIITSNIFYVLVTLSGDVQYLQIPSALSNSSYNKDQVKLSNILISRYYCTIVKSRNTVILSTYQKNRRKKI